VVGLLLLALGGGAGTDTTTSGLGVLATDAETPVVTETTVRADLLEALKVVTELLVDLVRENVGVLAVDKVTLPVKEPSRDLELSGVLEDGDDTLKLVRVELSGALGEVNVGLLADNVGVTTTNTLDLGDWGGLVWVWGKSEKSSLVCFVPRRLLPSASIFSVQLLDSNSYSRANMVLPCNCQQAVQTIQEFNKATTGLAANALDLPNLGRTHLTSDVGVEQTQDVLELLVGLGGSERHFGPDCGNAGKGRDERKGEERKVERGRRGTGFSTRRHETRCQGKFRDYNDVR
jgi:hypothetical protein